MKFIKENWKVLAILAIVAVLFSGNVLYRQRALKAELLNAALKEKARILEAEKVAIREKFMLLGEVSTIRISALTKDAIEKDRVSQGILVKKESEIKALRLTVGTWEEKYNLLEPECLKLSQKVGSLESVIEPLKLANAELEKRDLVRLANIESLEGKLSECQGLLDKSIANTDSLIKKPWALSLLGKLTVVAGVGVGVDGVMRPVVAVGIKIL